MRRVVGIALLCLLLAGMVIGQEEQEVEEEPRDYWEDLHTLTEHMSMKYRVFSKSLSKPIGQYSTEKLKKSRFQVCISEEEAIKFVEWFDHSFVEQVITELENLGFPARSEDMNEYPEDFQESLLSMYYEILGSDELIQSFVSYLSDIVLFVDYLQTEELITLHHREDCQSKYNMLWKQTEEVKQVIDTFRDLATEASVRTSWYMLSCGHPPALSSEVTSDCVMVGPLAPPVQEVFNKRINPEEADHVQPQSIPIHNDATLTLGFRIVHQNDTAPPTKLTVNSVQRRGGWKLDLLNSQTLAVKIQNAKTKDISVDPFYCEFDGDKITKCEVLGPRQSVPPAVPEEIIL